MTENFVVLPLLHTHTHIHSSAIVILFIIRQFSCHREASLYARTQHMMNEAKMKELVAGNIFN